MYPGFNIMTRGGPPPQHRETASVPGSDMVLKAGVTGVIRKGRDGAPHSIKRAFRT